MGEIGMRQRQFDQLTVMLDPGPSIASIRDQMRPLLRRAAMFAHSHTAQPHPFHLDFRLTALQRRLPGRCQPTQPFCTRTASGEGCCREAHAAGARHPRVLRSRREDLAGLDFLQTRAGKQDAIGRPQVSHVPARMALIVMCSTDFFGVHDSGGRAKARNKGRVFQIFTARLNACSAAGDAGLSEARSATPPAQPTAPCRPVSLTP